MKILFEVNGKQFSTESEAREYENALSSFSFDDNILLDRDGYRLKPIKEHGILINLDYILECCVYVKFASKNAIDAFCCLMSQTEGRYRNSCAVLKELGNYDRPEDDGELICVCDRHRPLRGLERLFPPLCPDGYEYQFMPIWLCMHELRVDQSMFDELINENLSKEPPSNDDDCDWGRDDDD